MNAGRSVNRINRDISLTKMIQISNKYMVRYTIESTNIDYYNATTHTKHNLQLFYLKFLLHTSIFIKCLVVHFSFYFSFFSKTVTI